ncbi:MAG: phosphatase PAP2 family protein [Chlorobi bacterium]|nr:phosphatase PAP2 family protein [Chlorobiota bacterium]
MQSKKRLITLFFFFLFASLLAQDNLNVPKCRLCKNNRHTALSPYTHSWNREVPFLITSAGLVLSGIVIDRTNPIKPYTIAGLDTITRNDVNPFDRDATYNWDPGLSRASDVLLLGSVLSPLLFLSNKSTRRDFGWLALMAGEVLSINYGLMTTVKNLTNRPRPYVYNYDAPLDERTGSTSLESFYSGHVSTTAAMSFFIATVLTQYHPDMKTGLKITIWAIAATYPAVTGYLRVASGTHYKTDVIVGYAVGAVTGWLVPYLHKKKNKNDRFSYSPTTIYGHAGVYLSYKF